MLWLFGILAASVVVAFAVFWEFTRQEDRAFILPAVLRDLYLPVVAWGLLTAIDARRRGRSGWWLYLLAAPVPGLNVVLCVQWLRRWRGSGPRVGRWQM